MPDRPTRKLIQIATSPDAERGYPLIVLCDDGSIWCLDLPYDPDHPWERLPDIPPGEDP